MAYRKLVAGWCRWCRQCTTLCRGTSKIQVSSLCHHGETVSPAGFQVSPWRWHSSALSGHPWGAWCPTLLQWPALARQGFIFTPHLSCCCASWGSSDKENPQCSHQQICAHLVLYYCPWTVREAFVPLAQCVQGTLSSLGGRSGLPIPGAGQPLTLGHPEGGCTDRCPMAVGWSSAALPEVGVTAALTLFALLSLALLPTLPPSTHPQMPAPVPCTAPSVGRTDGWRCSGGACTLLAREKR